MATKYEDSLDCLINFKATRGWRDWAHTEAANRGMTLTNYIKWLIEREAAVPDCWHDIATDLYNQLRQHEQPVPQPVVNALTRYDRYKQARY